MKFYSREEITSILLFVPLALIAIIGIRLLTPRSTLPPEELTRLLNERAADTLRPQKFDPNTVDYFTLRGLGLTRYEAVSLLRYREHGKVFRMPEDVATCYGIGDSLYAAIRPYIAIAERYRIKPTLGEERRYTPRKRTLLAVTRFNIDTVSAEYLYAIGAQSRRQAQVLVKWRDMHGIYNMDDLRECYTMNDSVAAALEPYLLFPEEPQTEKAEEEQELFPIDINRADSTLLCRVNGIGAKTARRIITYRERLGGFYQKEQLLEVKGMMPGNYEKILSQISCDSCDISKIDINFASSERLGQHPYIGPRSLRKLLKYRELKGGWSTAEEFFNDNILNRKEAEMIAPYVIFGNISGSESKKQ